MKNKQQRAVRQLEKLLKSKLPELKSHIGSFIERNYTEFDGDRFYVYLPITSTIDPDIELRVSASGLAVFQNGAHLKQLRNVQKVIV